jgi:glutamate racemase
LIGLFDSGVGGLSVLVEVRRVLPSADLLYVADRARAPYGSRSLADVEAIAHDVADWLIGRGADCLVVACNTASAAALDSLRDENPGLAIVGMEPAVKPAAAVTKTGTVAVYATAATFQGRLFNSVVSRFAAGVVVMTRSCPEWVDLVESGLVNGPDAESAVRNAVAPAVEAGADQIVLACTHFSFLGPLIARVGGIPVIDPAPAVALQVERVAPDQAGEGALTLAASGDTEAFAELARSLAGLAPPVIPFSS